MNLKDPSLFREAAFVAGTWRAAQEDGVAVINPATGATVGKQPSLSQREIETAIGAAREAFSQWREFTGKERAAVLRRWAELAIANVDDLAAIMTLEQGKPLNEAKSEIAYAASFLEWFSEEAKRGYGHTIPEPKRGQRVRVVKEPVGVCAAITPWNFPSAMVTRKVAPALAAGCTVVLKPAPQTPFSAMALCVLAERAGLPKGVLSVVTGDAEMIGEVLCASETVRKISFTGSTAVGKTLMAQASRTIKRLSLELGGNAPFIVFDDADLDAAVSGALASKFRNAGQTCVCVNRFLVQRGVHDRFVAKLRDAVATLRVGDGFAEGSTIGPLINSAAVEKVTRLVSEALARGASLALEMDTPKTGGHFYPPTVLTGVTAEMTIANDEIFGPVAAVTCFDSEDEAVALANATRYGLAAYVYTRHLTRSLRLERRLDYGIIGINEAMISTEVAPFGGMKESGFGKEGSFLGLDEYLDSKYVCYGGIA
ncbi:NAD-dependent succinate-semialdehyde dehydrogenase [Chitinasiproducens palmae]|uniref:Succinate-semialdehyde dehydrogenase / glutarate-semialdehyde dehydrogenase n=1 Tax=Chitinasiproducens palmae TaxID=1770053 RepID=A0A1H2PL69_9BURK|nr:NAD-dependent succinate-semialdehyde dehydrogenase [Chitinasiproducens palmae]SDV47231.1 succinate-semialdehyde dehydrogenase / glutarate-semialdehyde dehydrogenase [Chitinasiproducens palmae]